MRNQETGLEYANTDPSMHFNTIEPALPDWRDDYMKLLMDKDHEAAHELRMLSDPKYASEVEPQVTVMKTEHARLKSCREFELEEQLKREESEAAA